MDQFTYAERATDWRGNNVGNWPPRLVAGLSQLTAAGGTLGDLAHWHAPASPAPAKAGSAYAGPCANDYYGPLTVSGQGDELSLQVGPKMQRFVLTRYDGDTLTSTPWPDRTTAAPARSPRRTSGATSPRETAPAPCGCCCCRSWSSTSPTGCGPPRAAVKKTCGELYGLLVRLAGLTLTVLLVAAACEVALDRAAWQRAGTRVRRVALLARRLSPDVSDDGWLEQAGPRPRPRRPRSDRAHRPALVPVPPHLERLRVPAAPAPRERARGGPRPHRARACPGFWYGRRTGRPAARRAHRRRLPDASPRPASTRPATAYDRKPPGGRRAVLDALGLLLRGWPSRPARSPVVWVVCRRGRSETTHRPGTRRAASSGACRSPPSSCSPSPCSTPDGSARAGRPPAGCPVTPPSAASPWSRDCW
ncbi:hypothetical protein SVIOM74S_08923 [Streptomyces violarus]